MGHAKNFLDILNFFVKMHKKAKGWFPFAFFLSVVYIF